MSAQTTAQPTDSIGAEALPELLAALSEGSRRERQKAARVVSAFAKHEPAILAPHIPEIIDALECPEAQTRWEMLDALTALIAVDSRACDKAFVGAESALFDEECGMLRLSAMRFLCRLGSTTETRSEKVWPLLDEAIQCYHGDQEFQDMLVAVIEFSEGKLSDSVKQQLSARMAFDATNAKGSLKRRAAQIVANVS